MVHLMTVSQALNQYVRPQTSPLAVRMYTRAEEIPSQVTKPKRDLGKIIPVCQAFSMARRLGYTMAIGLEDQRCPLGNLALGFLPPKKRFLDGSLRWSFLETEEANRSYAQSIKMLEYGKYNHIVISPIDEATYEPHLIIIHGSPAQISRLVTGRLFYDGRLLNFHAHMGGSCSIIIAHTILNDECQIALLGAGQRRRGHDQDHEMAFTIPATKIELVIKGLKASENSDAYRYPSHWWMDYEVPTPPSYALLQDYLMEEDEEFKKFQ